jgi:hypothetical protein
MFEAIITTSSNKNAYSTVKTHFLSNNLPQKYSVNVPVNEHPVHQKGILSLAMGISATRAGLDNRKFANDKLFWTKIVSAFTDELNEE